MDGRWKGWRFLNLRTVGWLLAFRQLYHKISLETCSADIFLRCLVEGICKTVRITGLTMEICTWCYKVILDLKYLYFDTVFVDSISGIMAGIGS